MEKYPTMVSICCLAYNQENYITQCLEGIVHQKTTFPFELLIHDDASQDKTKNIIESYRLEYPDIVKPILQKDNKFSKNEKITVIYIYPRARGKYIAFCEGDDYWTDPDKLQKQVDFLENNPEYGMCFTRARQYDQEKEEFLPESFGAPVHSFSDLLNNGNRIPTLTVCMRKSILDQYLVDINPKDKNWLMGDYPIWLYVANHSKIHFLDYETGVYRVQNQSVSHYTDTEKQIRFYQSTYDIVFYFAGKYHEHLDIHIGLRDKIAFETYRNPEMSKKYRIAYCILKYSVFLTVYNIFCKFCRKISRVVRKNILFRPCI